MKAFLKQIRVSPKKANLVAALVRNKKVQEATDILDFTQKKSAPILSKLIKSATANAENNFNQKAENLYIKEIIVNEGPTYKRSIPISKGRTHPLLKRTTHIRVFLEATASPDTTEKQELKTKPKTDIKK
ncbi:50S ribosomal protein L22 [Patescibacteria group bacterium]|nr:50S ribosomal protein L22 [Patescibacteria group bacterium]